MILGFAMDLQERNNALKNPDFQYRLKANCLAAFLQMVRTESSAGNGDSKTRQRTPIGRCDLGARI
jgi:hypothetical protein